MIDRATKLRWRRRVRRSRRQVEDLGYQAEEHLERHFFRRLTRLWEVRRFVLTWIIVVGLLAGGVIAQTRGLSNHYQSLQPVAGGSFSEGIIGAFTNANPLYANGPVDSSVARLIFSGLMKYDQADRLVGDLAEKYSVDERGIVYTILLRPDLKWHDGQPLTSDDVVFTYQTIQNPDAKSPFASSWQGIKFETKGPRTIIITLPNVLASFPYSLTNGIVPKHLLEDSPVTQLRSDRFNTVKPIGSGPFKWDSIEVIGNTPETREEQVGLSPNADYYAGAPKLEYFTIRAFRSEDSMLKAFRQNELTAMSGLEMVPDNLPKSLVPQEYNLPLTSEVMAFFKTTSPILADVKIRKALIEATDQVDIVRGIGYPVIAAHGPLLQSHLGFAKDLTQFPTNLDDANKLLDEAGWTMGKDGIRMKDNKPLTLTLTSQSTSQYAYATQKLQSQWRKVGVDLVPDLKEESELQTLITVHGYDILLYGISLGIDPDVFPYWHSSQGVASANHLNFSDYKSPAADKALEAGRTRSDPAVRAVKYRPFLETWRNDAPALALYQPRYLYVARDPISGLNTKLMNIATDRYTNVHNWMVRQALVDKQ
jgi:peptide/nickel transport system substrate-binding protein